jgi:hypothetical protein
VPWWTGFPSTLGIEQVGHCTALGAGGPGDGYAGISAVLDDDS